CLLFFAAAKKSRCRPAQGQRLRREAPSRMPAQKATHTGHDRAAKAQRGCQRNRQSHTGHARAAQAQQQNP
ncbi:hypothetical protein, partial [Paraburkholderia bengalensis]|uniref:hypothetical protein n=1 Tax=Paraburkholderia bengalensis TaxID=2747562 RepID=UPI003014D8FA